MEEEQKRLGGEALAARLHAERGGLFTPMFSFSATLAGLPPALDNVQRNAEEPAIADSWCVVALRASICR